MLSVWILLYIMGMMGLFGWLCVQKGCFSLLLHVRIHQVLLLQTTFYTPHSLMLSLLVTATFETRDNSLYT